MSLKLNHFGLISVDKNETYYQLHCLDHPIQSALSITLSISSPVYLAGDIQDVIIPVYLSQATFKV